MMWTGTWRRPHSYGDPAGEAQTVHDSVGVIDVSTLGKLLVRGPDAAEFLERLYPEPLRRHEAGADPLRRPQLGRGPDHGRRHDRPPRRRRRST